MLEEAPTLSLSWSCCNLVEELLVSRISGGFNTKLPVLSEYKLQQRTYAISSHPHAIYMASRFFFAYVL